MKIIHESNEIITLFNNYQYAMVYPWLITLQFFFKFLFNIITSLSQFFCSKRFVENKFFLNYLHLSLVLPPDVNNKIRKLLTAGKTLDGWGPVLLLLHRGAVCCEKRGKGCREWCEVTYS